MQNYNKFNRTTNWWWKLPEYLRAAWHWSPHSGAQYGHQCQRSPASPVDGLMILPGQKSTPKSNMSLIQPLSIQLCRFVEHIIKIQFVIPMHANVALTSHRAQSRAAVNFDMALQKVGVIWLKDNLCVSYYDNCKRIAAKDTPFCENLRTWQWWPSRSKEVFPLPRKKNCPQRPFTYEA